MKKSENENKWMPVTLNRLIVLHAQRFSARARRLCLSDQYEYREGTETESNNRPGEAEGKQLLAVHKVTWLCIGHRSGSVFIEFVNLHPIRTFLSRMYLRTLSMFPRS